MNNYSRTAVIAFLYSCIACSFVSASEFKLQVKTLDRSPVPFPEIMTVISVSGEIESGLLEALEEKVDAVNQDNFYDGGIAVSLNSAGGSFKEAIRVGNYLSLLGITTLIEEGNECLSACAIVFMAGRFPPHEGPGGVSRFMDVGAEIGFHAPFINRNLSGLLTELDKEASIQLLSDAYQLGIRQIGLLMSTHGSSGTKWPPSLMGEVLLTPFDEFLRIRTVDDAGRWSIGLIGFSDQLLPSLEDPEVRFTVCMNAVRWSDEEKWLEYPASEVSSDDYVRGWSSQQELTETNSEFRRYTLPYDNLNVLACEVTLNATFEFNFVSGSAITNGDEGIVIEKVHHFRPDVLLSEIK